MRTSAVRRARTTARAHPSLMLALKAALAAMLAWLLIQPFGGLAAEYPYYAPLGALAVVSTSIAVSVRSSIEVVVSILLGAGIALVARLLPLPEPLPLGLAVVVASLLAAWGVTGAMGSWIPLAAMFVLIAGRGDPVEYSAAYGGLVALGALVGIAVNLALPQLLLTPAALAQDRLRAELADRLDELATALEQEIVGERDWNELRHSLARTSHHAEDLIREARQARRANWKAARWADTADRHEVRAEALHSLTGCVDAVTALVADQRAEIRHDDPDAAELRGRAAVALHAVAELLRDTACVDDARAAVSDLRIQVVQAQAQSGNHHFAAAAITLNLEQAVDAWT